MNTTSCSEQGCGVAVAERQRYYARQVMIRFINSANQPSAKPLQQRVGRRFSFGIQKSTRNTSPTKAHITSIICYIRLMCYFLRILWSSEYLLCSS